MNIRGFTFAGSKPSGETVSSEGAESNAALPKPSRWKAAKERVNTALVKTTATVVAGAAVVTGVAVDQLNDSSPIGGSLASGCQLITPDSEFEGVPANPTDLFSFDVTHAQLEQGVAPFVEADKHEDRVSVNARPVHDEVDSGEPFAVAGPPRIMGQGVDYYSDSSRFVLDAEGGRAFVSANISGYFGSIFGYQKEIQSLGAGIPLPADQACYVVSDGTNSFRVEVDKLEPSASPEALAAAQKALKDFKFSPSSQRYDAAVAAVWSLSSQAPEAEALRKELFDSQKLLLGT